MKVGDATDVACDCSGALVSRVCVRSAGCDATVRKRGRGDVTVGTGAASSSTMGDLAGARFFGSRRRKRGVKR